MQIYAEFVNLQDFLEIFLQSAFKNRIWQCAFQSDKSVLPVPAARLRRGSSAPPATPEADPVAESLRNPQTATPEADPVAEMLRNPQSATPEADLVAEMLRNPQTATPEADLVAEMPRPDKR